MKIEHKSDHASPGNQPHIRQGRHYHHNMEQIFQFHIQQSKIRHAFAVVECRRCRFNTESRYGAGNLYLEHPANRKQDYYDGNRGRCGEQGSIYKNRRRDRGIYANIQREKHRCRSMDGMGIFHGMVSNCWRELVVVKYQTMIYNYQN